MRYCCPPMKPVEFLPDGPNEQAVVASLLASNDVAYALVAYPDWAWGVRVLYAEDAATIARVDDAVRAVLGGGNDLGNIDRQRVDKIAALPGLGSQPHKEK